MCKAYIAIDLFACHPPSFVPPTCFTPLKSIQTVRHMSLHNNFGFVPCTSIGGDTIWAEDMWHFWNPNIINGWKIEDNLLRDTVVARYSFKNQVLLQYVVNSIGMMICSNRRKELNVRIGFWHALCDSAEWNSHLLSLPDDVGCYLQSKRAGNAQFLKNYLSNWRSSGQASLPSSLPSRRLSYASVVSNDLVFYSDDVKETQAQSTIMEKTSIPPHLFFICFAIICRAGPKSMAKMHLISHLSCSRRCTTQIHSPSVPWKGFCVASKDGKERQKTIVA